MEQLAMIGIGVGLASVAGVRAFLPLALAAAFFVFGVFVLTGMTESLMGWPVVAGLFGLAVLEGILDKIKALDRGLNWAMAPVRAASGAVLFSLAMEVGPTVEAVPWLVAGALISGIVALLKVFLRPPAKIEASGVSTRFLSFVEDLVALVGGILGILIPFVPVIVVGFLLFFYFRVRKRRGRKYGGLRILGD
ncbi:MAG: DUF4126 domain-containing protein [Rubrobacter sp.]|nr:DUF4126 domain-containing protein [Rubrobacter sp.]